MLYLFLFLPSFLFLASLIVVGVGEYFVDLLLEFCCTVDWRRRYFRGYRHLFIHLCVC